MNDAANTETAASTDRRSVKVEGISREEANRLEVALADPEIRAFSLVAGVLRSLASDRARARVLAYVSDLVAEDEVRAAPTLDDIARPLAEGAPRTGLDDGPRLPDR